MTEIQEISIAGRKIGPAHPPFVIAELSANHNGDINRAFQIMEMSKRSGADAIKLQTYHPDTITFKSDAEEFQIHGGLWDGYTLYDLYDWAHMPWDWHKPLFDRAQALDITIFSSPFDTTAIDLLEDLNAPAYKIASFEAIDLPLIRYAASTGKPMIISTGMANQEEIGEAIAAARDGGCNELAVLHCISGYPAPSEEYNLRTLPDMARRFGVIPGLSDHTINNVTAIASVALGACVIEKHVTLDRSGGGPDDSFSLEERELATLCRDVKIAWQALGNAHYERSESELGNVKFRRSLYVTKTIQKGETFTAEHVRSIRPGFGLQPKHLDTIIGAIATQDVGAGTALTWDMVKQT